MSRTDDKRLDDIAATIAEVNDIVARGRPALDNDITLRRALERCMEIIGEASKALSDDARSSIPGVRWSSIMRLRDLLSHHYHRVQADQLWTTACDDIRLLEDAINRARRSSD